MSSASREPRPERVRALWRRNTLGLRLTLGYALLFALSAVALFALTYALLGHFLQEQDEAFLQTQLRLVEEAYAQGGVAAVQRHAASLRADDRGEEVLIRIADSANRTRLLVPADEWEPRDLRALERTPPRANVRQRLWHEREDESAEVVTRRLPGGDVLQVGMTSDERDDVLESFPRVFVVISLPLLLLALFGGAFMAYRALRPIRRLVTTLDALVTTGDVRARAPAPDEQGEFAELFRLFNRMLDRIEALVARLRGTLDDVAHDLRTPMTRLRGAAEVALQQERDPEAYRDALARIVEASEAATATLDAIMEAAEAEAGMIRLHREPVAVADLVQSVADLYDLVAEEKAVTFETGVEEAGHASLDRRRMRQALANLVDNAVKYTPPGGRVTVEARYADGATRIAVRDTGVGIGDDELPRIWDRLYRSERTRHERGLGLGLSFVRAIVEAHGGHVAVESEPGSGSTFTVVLPASPP